MFVINVVNAMNAQIQTSSWHDGYWGEWRRHTSRIHPSYNKYKLYGNYSGFIVYNNGDHPSEFIFKFQINTFDFIEPTKKIKKQMIKLNKWYEYSGEVEYYVTEKYPTITAVLRTYGFPYFSNNSGSAGNPCVKRTANATIKIAPYKDHPECYNIYFDDVAVAITLDGVHF